MHHTHKKQITKLNIIFFVFLAMLFVLLVLVLTRDMPEKRYVLLSFDVEPIDLKGNVTGVLEILERNDVNATFFVTGEYAAKHPDVVKKIVRNNRHEIGSHTYSHPVLTKLSKDEQREEIVASKILLEKVSGKQVLGFRSPYHRMNSVTLDVLEEEGFVYDASIIQGISSIFPSPRGREIGEIPVSSVFGIAVEDVIWVYYLHLRAPYFYIMKHKTREIESYLFHPRQIMKDAESFESFIKYLKQQNVIFISHSGLIIQQDEGV